MPDGSSNSESQSATLMGSLMVRSVNANNSKIIVRARLGKHEEKRVIAFESARILGGEVLPIPLAFLEYQIAGMAAFYTLNTLHSLATDGLAECALAQWAAEAFRDIAVTAEADFKLAA